MPARSADMPVRTLGNVHASGHAARIRRRRSGRPTRTPVPSRGSCWRRIRCAETAPGRSCRRCRRNPSSPRCKQGSGSSPGIAVSLLILFTVARSFGLLGPPIAAVSLLTAALALIAWSAGATSPDPRLSRADPGAGLRYGAGCLRHRPAHDRRAPRDERLPARFAGPDQRLKAAIRTWGVDRAADGHPGGQYAATRSHQR